MSRFAIVLAVILAALLLCLLPAQQREADPDPPLFTVSIENVMAPVVVTDRDDRFVNGLQPHQFRLYDNDKEQNIKVDVAYQPISMVIAIQKGGNGMETVLPKIQKIGNLVKSQMVGDNGEVAVMAFDHRFDVMQEFTTDPDKIEAAIKKIKPGSSTKAIKDAISEGVRMLRSRPPNRRRILLIVSETRDRGSSTRPRVAVMNAQLNNVLVYSVDISRLITTLYSKQDPGRPSKLLPAQRPMPGGVAATPTTVDQMYGLSGGRAEFIPLLIEILKDVKSVFVDNPIELITKATGGKEFDFYTLNGLENALNKIGEDLHSQYIISYQPNNKDEGGFHKIAVEVIGHPRDYKIRTRPGYYLAPKN